MKRDKQIQIFEQVFAELDKPKNERGADPFHHQIDAGRYTSRKRFEKEQALIFNNFPIVTGPAQSLKKSGDYFTYDYSGQPIVVIKGDDGEIRAFLNICRHRGVRLLDEASGTVKKYIVCPYHAWSYDTAGCLKHVFHQQGFEGIGDDSHNLIELDCWVRLGLVMVLPNPELKGTIDIDKWLSEIDQMTEGFDLGDCHPFHTRKEELACNWKLIVDGALEGYHFKIAHAKTIGPYFLDNMSIPMDNNRHSSLIFPKRAMKKMRELPQKEWDFRKGANVLLHLFPNAIMLIEPDHAMVVTLCPIDEKRTQTYSFMLLPSEPVTDKAKEYWELNASIFWTAIAEDNEMAVLQQKSFNGYDKTSMTIGAFERLLVQFEDLVDKALEGTADPA